MTGRAILAMIGALDGWASAQRGRSYEVGLRADTITYWHATAWFNGEELATASAKTPHEARSSLLLAIQARNAIDKVAS